MRILALVTDGFGGHGGIALYVRNLLTALCEHPSRPEVVAVPRIVPKPTEPMPENLDFRVGAKDSKVRYVGEVLRLLVTQRRFDLVVATHMNLLPLAAIARRACSAPLMLMVYGLDVRPRREWLFRPLLRQVDACVSIRERTTERLRSWTDLRATRCYLLENAIDLTSYGPGPKRPDLIERYGLAGKKVLMTLGRMDDRDFGVDEICGVLPELAAQVPNLLYVVVGGGTELEALKGHARALGVAERVVFTDKIDDADKADHYRLADAFAMPGTHPLYFDRYPLRFVFLEAMACGLPVVASRPEELVDLAASPLPHIYVNPTDRVDLLAGLREALRRGPGQVPAELERYGYPSFRRRAHAILDEVLERGARRPS